jgi:hypothetical protein
MRPNDLIAKMKSEVDGLKGLLDDPHPGLFSWVDFLNSRMVALSRLWWGDEEVDGMLRRAGREEEEG